MLLWSSYGGCAAFYGHVMDTTTGSSCSPWLAVRAAMVISGAPFIAMIIANPSWFALIDPDDFDALSALSRTLKNYLADAFLAFWLRDHVACAALAAPHV